jgi:hypothetical protein
MPEYIRKGKIYAKSEIREHRDNGLTHFEVKENGRRGVVMGNTGQGRHVHGLCSGKEPQGSTHASTTSSGDGTPGQSGSHQVEEDAKEE